MKETENYEQLLERFTKRIAQINSKKASTPQEMEKINEQLHYLRGCKETIEYLMTGQLPNDGNHDGMKNHKPVNKPTDSVHTKFRYNKLDSMD